MGKEDYGVLRNRTERGGAWLGARKYFSQAPKSPRKQKRGREIRLSKPPPNGRRIPTKKKMRNEGKPVRKRKRWGTGKRRSLSEEEGG